MDIISEEEFYDGIALLSKEDATEFADRLRVSRPSVLNWLERRNAPVGVLRHVVIESLRKFHDVVE